MSAARYSFRARHTVTIPCLEIAVPVPINDTTPRIEASSELLLPEFSPPPLDYLFESIPALDFSPDEVQTHDNDPNETDSDPEFQLKHTYSDSDSDSDSDDSDSAADNLNSKSRHVVQATPRKRRKVLNHSKYVTGSKNLDLVGYQCPQCDAFLVSSSHLRRHMRTHYGIKPYVCYKEDCARRFARRDNMVQHYRSHFKVRKSKCGRKYKKEVEGEGVGDGGWECLGGLENTSRHTVVGFWKAVEDSLQIPLNNLNSSE